MEVTAEKMQALHKLKIVSYKAKVVAEWDIMKNGAAPEM